uniref:SET domain-containing protein n=1 Tax=Knipowitschia caucasica TaxID=637954 RepID=A0AAV2KFR1_KNICA
MRYVTPASSRDQQNLVACQSGLHIFFYTITTLPPGTELMVWYCPQLAKRCNYPPLGRMDNHSTAEGATARCTVPYK